MKQLTLQAVLPCPICGTALPQPRARFCGRKCRQTAWRVRRLAVLNDPGQEPATFAYADPPYPGTAAKYYRHEPTFAGEVDHAALIRDLEQRRLDGWALSTSARALRDILPLCPPRVRVCAWVKPHAPRPGARGPANTWEPLILCRGRRHLQSIPDRLIAYPARGGGALPGRKPIAFACWLFALLGMAPGDILLDLFPGTGIISAAWRELSQPQ